MKTRNFIVVGLLALVFVASPIVTNAQTIQELQALVVKLQARLNNLLQTNLNSISSTPTCTGSPCVAMVYPNGGETLVKGQPNTIRWFSNGVPIANPDPLDHFQIELGEFIFSAPMGSTSFTSNLNFDRLVPGRYGMTIAYYRNEQRLASDTTNAPFTIADFFPITVTAPNGGEVWQNQRTHLIQWTPYGYNPDINPASTTVAYLEKKINDNFVTVGKIFGCEMASLWWCGYLVGEFQEPIPHPLYPGSYYYDPPPFLSPPGDYYVRLVNKVTGAWDRSDQPFTLAPENAIWVDLKINGSDGVSDNHVIIVPKGANNTDYLASWTSNSQEKCALDYYFESDPFSPPNEWSWQEIRDLPPNGNSNIKIFPFVNVQSGAWGYVSLHCPTSISGSGVEGSGFDVIYLYYDSIPTATTASVVGANTVKVISPDGGKNIDWAIPQVITWTATADVETVSIALYKNSMFYRWIVRDLPGQIKNYRWTPSKTISVSELGNNFQIDVVGRKKNPTGIIADKSDQPFSIINSASPSISTVIPIAPIPTLITPPPTSTSSTPVLISSTPPHGAIDARENQLVTTLGAGWKSLDLTFSGPPSDLTYDSFSVAGSNPAGAPKARFVQIDAQNSSQAVLTLTRPIQPGERLTITHKPSNTSVCLGFLPGDVNQDGRANVTDISTIRSWLGQTLTADSSYRWDINRDGVFNQADVTRASEILSDKTLPACPQGGVGVTTRQSQLANALSSLQILQAKLQALKQSLSR